MDAVFIRGTLLPLLRAGLGLASEKPEAGIDYSRLLEIGKEQAILPMIRVGLKAHSLEGEGPDAIEAQCLSDIYMFAQRDFALEEIRRCFAQNEIPYVLLKGSTLRELYPEPWMRTSCDIDILIHREDMDRATAALESETEFRQAIQEKRDFHDVSFYMGPTHLELHFSIQEDMEGPDQLLSRAWEFTEQGLQPQQYVFSSEFLIFHVVSHMAYHFTHGGLGVRPYIDLWLLRHKTEYQEMQIRELCNACGLLKFYENCVRLSEIWLANQPYDALTERTEQYCFDGGVFGNFQNAFLSKQRTHRGIRYVFHRLFLPAKQLKQAYPRLEKYPALLPYYQLRRWPKAFTSKKQYVKNELQLLSNTQKTEADEFDAFLKSVGL